jgi:salicylate hydroxylase
MHRAGHEVTLFDQFDSPKPLGSGLLIQPSGQAILAELGLLETIQSRSAVVERLQGVNIANNKRALDMEYRHLGKNSHALGIHRASLFATLYDAVCKTQIKIQTASKFSGVTEYKYHILPHFEGRDAEDTFDLLIDASGSHGPLAKGKSRTLPFAALWTTVDIPAGGPAGRKIANAALDQRYEGAHKMAGIMPVGINPATGNQGTALFWSVKPAEVESLYEQGIESWRQAFLKVWPEAEAFVQQVESFDDLTLAIYQHRTGKPSSQRRVFHIGDSWHCTSPQLGQGANMALMDSAALATAIKSSIDPGEILRLYQYLRKDHVDLYQLLSLMFTPLYQSDSIMLPAIRDRIIHNLARLPVFRTLIAQVVSGNFLNFNGP